MFPILDYGGIIFFFQWCIVIIHLDNFLYNLLFSSRRYFPFVPFIQRIKSSHIVYTVNLTCSLYSTVFIFSHQYYFNNFLINVLCQYVFPLQKNALQCSHISLKNKSDSNTLEKPMLGLLM